MQYETLIPHALDSAAKEVPPLFTPEASKEIASRIIFAYQNAIDLGYSQYPDIKSYLNVSPEVAEINAAIRAKKQVIQMFTREIIELEGKLNELQ